MELAMEQIVPVILILVGVLFVLIGLVLTMRVKAAANWPATPGVILKSELAERTTKQRTGNHRVLTYTSYEPMVEYQYTVNEKVLTGNRLSFGLTRLPLEKAQELLNKFAVNAQVPVYYNPRKVKESRLEIASAAAVPQLVIGIIIGGIGVVWLLMTLI
jgi:hypothetical protein